MAESMWVFQQPDFRSLDRLIDPKNSGKSALSTDGNWMVNVTSPGTVQLWCLKNQQKHLAETLTIPTKEIKSIALSGTGAVLIVGTVDRGAHVWRDHGAHHQILPISQDYAVRVVDISDDGQWGLTCTDDGFVRVWSFENPEPTVYTHRRHHNVISAATIDPSGQWIAVATAGGRGVHIWNRLLPQTDYAECLTGTAAVKSLSFSDRGKKLVVLTLTENIRIWSLEDQTDFMVPHEENFGLPSVAKISRDGDLVAIGHRLTGKLTFWRCSEDGYVKVLHGHCGGVDSISMDRSGHRLLSSCWANDTLLWDLVW